MNISKVIKIYIFCCIIHTSIDYNISNAAMLNNVDLEPTETYLCTAIHNNLFKHNAKLYNNNMIFDIDKTQISIDRTGKYNLSDSFEERKEFGKLQLEKFNRLKQLLGKDFITYLEKDAKEIFGSKYKVYFNYLDINYNGRKKIKHTNIYAEYFKGTFEELMKSNNYQLVSKINYNLQFMKNVWFSNSQPKHLTITNYNITYYFDIDNNKILIYSKRQNSWQKSENVLVAFMSKFKKRWNEEQIAIHKVFGNDYKIYYHSLDVDCLVF